jgi:hypothetical protein
VLELWGPNRAVGFESTVSRGVKLPWVLFTRWLEIALIPEVLGGGGAVFWLEGVVGCVGV